jgi:hypothetical protein
MDLFKIYQTDSSLEENGVWEDIGDAKFLIARTGNKKYIKYLSREFKKNQKVLDRKDDAADKLSEEIMIEAIARTILLDWSGVKVDGREFPYTQENAKKALALHDFRSDIMKCAENFGAYKTFKDEEDGKN